jgi:hypothetical protein
MQSSDDPASLLRAGGSADQLIQTTMTTNEIKRSVDLSNAGRVKDMVLSDQNKQELREAGYVVSGSTVYGPAWKGERFVTYPVRQTAVEHDYEGAILARQNGGGL